jgi:hypothetical protein
MPRTMVGIASFETSSKRNTSREALLASRISASVMHAQQTWLTPPGNYA